MRNWNKIRNSFKLLTLSFYSTYEELKRNPKNNCQGSSFIVFTVPRGIETYKEHTQKPLTERFYSTYEELKLLQVPFFCPKINCFYSTYEELKHDIGT